MGLRWPVPSMRPRPLLLPFDSGFPTHSKLLGHDFRTKKWSVIKCVVSTVLCCDMEHGAQMSVTLRCLLQQKPTEVSRRSVQFPLKKADKSKPLHPNFGCSASNQRPTKRLVTAWCCFSQCWVVTWNVVLISLCTWAVGVMNEVWHFSSSNKKTSFTAFNVQ